MSTQKQRLWSEFHSARISELRRLWTDLFSSLGVDSKFAQDPLLGEYVNEKLFEEHIKEKFEVEEQCVAMANSTLPESLNYADSTQVLGMIRVLKILLQVLPVKR